MGRSDVGEGELLVFRGDERDAYRLLETRFPEESDWRSHYERGALPRRVELGSALAHMSVSMWLSEDQAVEVNERFGGRLGSFVARVELRGEDGIWFAETGVEGHVTVWGRPSDLQRCCLAVTPV